MVEAELKRTKHSVAGCLLVGVVGVFVTFYPAVVYFLSASSNKFRLD